VQRLDTDNNEILSPTELRQLMKEQNLPDYIADQMVTNFDLNADGGLDTLEFTKAYSTFDHNQNGKLDFNESLEMNSITSGANIVAGPDDIKQYQAIFNYTDYFIKLRDDTTDRKLTPVELSDYFRELKMPDYMATSAVTRYDLNGDGSLDVYEWMKPHIAFDVNINGKIDFNELMGMAEDIAGITIPVTPTNEIQVTNLYNSSLNFLKTLDKDNDIKFGFDEYRSYLLTQGLPDNLAQSIINLFDVNADSGIDIMEWLKANVDYDANLNGVLDFNETLNMYQAATGIAFNATESNKIQYQNLYKAALSQIAFIDKDTDKKFSVSEYSTYLRQCNLPDYMANNGVNLFDINNDGSLDALEWMKALIDNDTNSSGAIDYDELINLYSQESGTGITANQSNIAQYKLIFGIGINNVIYMDTDANKICSAGEYEVFLRKYGMPDYVTNNAITTYDMNGDGGFDAMEWTRMVINFDINRNGKFDLDEVMNYYGSVTGINFGANPSNLVQFSNIYNNSIKVISSIDTSGNKIFNESEYTAALKAAGLPSNIATGMIAYFDLNNDGGIDSLEFMKLTKDLDHNSNGLMDFNEAMDYYSAASGINLGATEANSKQYGSLWNQSLATIKAIDKDNDKRLSVDEYRIYLRSIGLPDYVANNAVASIDLNHDGGFDAIEWMRNSLNLDTNNSGVIDFRELLNYYGAHSGIAFNTTINNEYQHQKAYSASLGTIKYMDLNQDKIMDLNEYRVALKAAGLPEYVASGAMSAYDLNGDGGLDALEWTRLTLNLDGNQNGVMDFYEVMQFYETATGINFNASINNATQLQKCYSAYNGFVRKVDLNYDQRMSADEYRPTVLAAKKPSSAADNAISIYDINGDGGLDTFEWMIAVLNFDANQSGVLEGAEVTAWYASF
jgi:Ca2+-binding EF-hand superfamily protein